MGLEAKKREVLQLLKDYRTYWTGYGGARATDETGVKDASYGAAGYIEAGQEFTEGQRKRLAESFEALDRALERLRNGGPLRSAAYLVLLKPYLGDPGDPSVVAEWRKNRSDCRTQWHDLAVEELAEFLKDEDLFVIFPKRMTSWEEKQVERRNDEFYALYQRYRSEMSRQHPRLSRVLVEPSGGRPQEPVCPYPLYHAVHIRFDTNHHNVQLRAARPRRPPLQCHQPHPRNR